MAELFFKVAYKLGYRISKVSVWDNVHDFIPEASDDELKTIKSAMKYSMCSMVRMWSLMQAVKHIYQHNIEGDIVECGVWKGGNIILASLSCNKLDLQKTFWAYDTYKGMSKPVDIDVDTIRNKVAKTKWKKTNKGDYNFWCYSSFNEVEENFKRELPDISNIKMIKGMVEETLDDPQNVPDKISILRLDTDFYESTKKELEVLYPRLQPGGVLIIDDYGHWKGARQAVDEYFEGRKIWLHRIDYSARLMVKNQ